LGGGVRTLALVLVWVRASDGPDRMRSAYVATPATIEITATAAIAIHVGTSRGLFSVAFSTRAIVSVRGTGAGAGPGAGAGFAAGAE
jgi:hypothetical protein